MAFTLQISPRVQFRVAGTLRDAEGVDQAFDFTLTCKRLDTAAYNAAIRGKTDDEKVDAMASWIEDWGGVNAPGGQPADCTPEAVRQLLAVPGMAQLVFSTYAWEASARAKN